LNSVSDIENDFGVSVYPNPVKENLNLFLSKNDRVDRIDIEICNVLGKKVYTTRIEHPDSHLMLPASNLSAGSYFVKISSGERNGIARFNKIN
jgi:hypothetical protein